ncbi:hypothetical protein TSACC_23152 [Terrimicrobium sacchariphilum]|uniref:Uncharacterized protein n=1 Tax=Terrimicrobium sacchariphilum TaxID=690879 RepID=A0A146GAS1_TERSA|nr:roadblock/LC7 domain-containing protein [Terrimicrobium sacchariphilum]GAT34719.1 hypothetical protein TSACC_23152 [Terrimicrobium sacchariphilum]
MKQSKVPKPSQQSASSPASVVPAGPRYRYYQTPPEKLSLRAGDLLAIVPDAYWVRGYNAEKLIDLPATEVLTGPVPKVSMSRLAEIAPECFQAVGEDIKVALPIARLARTYTLETHSEVIKEPAPLIDIVLPSSDDDQKESNDFAPKESKDALEDKKVTSRLTPFKLRPDTEDLLPLPPKAPEAKSETPSTTESKPESTAHAQEHAKPEAPKQEPQPKPGSDSGDSLEKTGSLSRPARPLPPRRPETPAIGSETVAPPPPAPAAETLAPATPPPAPIPAPVQPQHPPAKTIFSMLPIFKRKAAPPPTPISTTPPAPPTPITKRARVELPPPKIHIAPPAPLSGEHPLPAGFTPPPPPPPVDPLPKPDTDPEVEKAETQKGEIAVKESIKSPGDTVKSVESAKPPITEVSVPPDAPIAPASESPSRSEQTPTLEPAKPEPIKAEPVAKAEPMKPESPIPQPLAKASPAVLVETEHLPKKGPDAVGNQDEIQSIFLTEEYLSVDRIVQLCGALPGINSCVLSHGASVIASHNVPDSIDLVSLSAHALEMLRAMRESSAKMGIGAVPAVTIHSEKGPITFFHQEDLCLLVLHKDRGFIPGVREKLQLVIEALGKANLPKPLPSSHPATLEG